MNLFLLYLEFFKIGTFSIGGGLAALPFLYQMADKYEWLTREMVGNFLAVAQMSPGPIGVNMSALAGFEAAGPAGGLLAPLGLVSPAIVVISVVARMLQSFKENKIVESVFLGLRPAAAGLLLSAGLGAIMVALYDQTAFPWYNGIKLRECIFFVLLVFSIYKFKKHPVLYIAIACAAGIVFEL
jgi:chromate transporter